MSSQTAFFSDSDTLLKKRITPVAIGTAAVWTSGVIALHSVWYSQYPKTDFHFYDDSKNWLQMDKMGHVFSNYQLSRYSGQLFKWTGLSPKKSMLIGTAVGFGFQTTLELFDGYSKNWGFSWSDVAANAIGAGFYLSQEWMWQEQRIHLKFSYHNSPYAAIRPSVLGANLSEKILKDYNGQTYWISFHPVLLRENSAIPKWINLSVGYSVDAKLVGDQDTYVHWTTNGPITYQAQRQLLFSLDVDLSKLPVKRSWLKTILKQLNSLKVPFPALLLQNGKLSTKALYF
jgi:uncharacterized protein YfiM (DUF2279 family)